MRKSNPIARTLFFEHAKDLLNQKYLFDLHLLSTIDSINEIAKYKAIKKTPPIKKDLCEFINSNDTWLYYWQTVEKKSHTFFLHTYAKEIIKLFLKTTKTNLDPLAQELAIAQMQIEIMDNIKGLDTFGQDRIIYYYLKLLINERISSFEEKKGQQILLQLKNNIHQRVSYE